MWMSFSPGRKEASHINQVKSERGGRNVIRTVSPLTFVAIVPVLRIFLSCAFWAAIRFAAALACHSNS